MLQSFLNRRGFGFTHVIVLMPYNAQLDLIRAAVRQLLPEVFVCEGTKQPAFETKTTVTLSQGTLNWLVIHIDGRDPNLYIA